MALEFLVLQRELLPNVPMLRGRQARAFNEALGLEKDRYIGRLKIGVKARWTSGSRMRAAADAVGATIDDATLDPERLRLIGLGFDLPRLGTMTDAAYQDYIDRAWEIWGLGGTCAAIVAAVQAFGIPDAYVFEEWEGSVTPPGAEYAKRLILVLGPDYGSLGVVGTTLGGTFVLGESLLGITGMTEAQAKDLVRLFRKWKDAEALMVDALFLIGETTLIGYNFVLGESLLGGGEDSGVAIMPITSQDALGNFILGVTLLGVNYHL